MNILRVRWLGILPLLLGAILVTVLSGAVESQGPGLYTADGRLGQISYVYYYAERGLRLMILHDAAEVTLKNGAVSTPRPARWFAGRGLREGQPLFDWELETADRGNPRFRIDGQVFDLTNGTVFTVQSANGTTLVRQLQHDLSGTPSDPRSVARFAAAYPGLSDFAHGVADREARH